MKKNLYFLFIAASFALLACAPGRLAYGLPLIVELNLLVLCGTAFANLLRNTELGNLRKILTLSFIVFLTILYKQLLILISPVIALTLSFVLYIPAVSVFLIGSLFSQPAQGISKNFLASVNFSAFAFVFFFLRDVLGYGTISLPVYNGITEYYLFDSYKTAFLNFFATTPGALLILVLCMAGLLSVQNHMNIIERAGESE